MKVFSPVSVLRRGGDEREASDHDAFDHVVHGAERRRGSLSPEHLEEVAVIRVGFEVVALLDGLRDLLPDRASPAAVGVLPGEPVLLAGTADDALCVLRRRVALALAVRVVELRVDVAFTDLDRIELVAADAAVHELLPPGGRIERPAAVA